MTLDRTDPLDVLYLELVPTRPTPWDSFRMCDGPTAAFAALELERERWRLVLEVGSDEDEELAS